ncbi:MULTISPECIES: SprT family zinc-dependent metalloprotease [Xanthomonas]|uniref:M48 family metallopeptidase n=1 Tax=Xanthomonas cucurbitae TaxID=56453 RepID=A0ABY7YCL3_9XANT|nr:SprT family zinc-dependent metalloprotease [Xanthomonas cucurbitae]WDM67698.1 M48 family metallopeptidase [Xanthomonas cucurbitae]WDM71574.1 M48 family metallopeptidase [Xanthomonas cucurbitae]WDM75418.1 M48 family metallopeptidase [Xanthomonas cucurbitae]
MFKPVRRLIAPAPHVVERDCLHVQLDGQAIEVLRVRDPRARRIKLSVDERGARLTLPPRASLVAGERFVHAHLDWLGTQLSRYQQADAFPALQRGVPGLLPLRGALLPLCWHEGRYARIELDDNGVHFHLPARLGEAGLRRTLKEFYEAQARADVGRWLPSYLPGLPRPPARLRLKVMSSQWGSLAPDGSMALDLALVLGRSSAFEYVLVHELCHLLQANHSPAFWAEVERRFPTWRDERSYFHEHGRQLKAQLRRLLQPS